MNENQISGSILYLYLISVITLVAIALKII